jgi:hypothetical protein
VNDLLRELEGKVPAALFNALADLPPSLKLERIAYYRASPDVVRQKRGAFTTLKGSFLQHMAAHYADELRAMNVSDAGLIAMRDFGMFPENRPGERLDMSIDHKLSLFLGGSNDFANLMLLPDRLNELKNQLEKCQLDETVSERREMITILPATDTPIPFIPGGFQKPKTMVPA